ncbi:MAG TPA: hypothetical protein PKM25_15505 [Candidatus Ozemobacteraceae bacterium]|nr:hypothetical protein [Candidatus Ozemobacteraceae bacterium]
MKMHRILFTGVLGVLVSLCSIPAEALPPPDFPPAWIEKRAPAQKFVEYDLVDLQGQRWNSFELRGKPVVILTGHRDIRLDIKRWGERLKHEFADSGNIALFYAVNLSQFPWTTEHEDAEAWWREQRLPIPVALDWHALIGRALKIAYVTPNVIILDRDNLLVYHGTGPCEPASWELVRNILRLLIADHGSRLNLGPGSGSAPLDGTAGR